MAKWCGSWANVREVGGGVRKIGEQGFLSSLFSAGQDIYHGLKDLGFSDDDARRYEDMVDRGNVLLAIRCGGDCGHLQRILGGYQVFTNYGAIDWSRYRTGIPAPERSIPIREEQLRAEKESRQAGEVDVTKSVVQEPRSMRVPVTHEEVDVRYKEVPPRPADRQMGEETIRVPVTEEGVSVTKEPRVTGEIEIGKRQVTEEREFSGEVKKEVPRVEKKGEVRGETPPDEVRDEVRKEERDI